MTLTAEAPVAKAAALAPFGGSAPVTRIAGACAATIGGGMPRPARQ